MQLRHWMIGVSFDMARILKGSVVGVGRAPGASNRLADPTAVFGGLKKSLWKCGVADCRTRFDHMTIADLAPTVGRRSLIVRMLGPQFITAMRTNQEYAGTHDTSPKYCLSSNSPPSLMARWFCSLSLPWWKKSLSWPQESFNSRAIKA